MKTPNTQQGSITLGLVFGLGMLGLGIAAATMTFSTSAISNNSTAAQGVRSLVTADAATREGVYRAIDSVSGTNVTFSGATIPLLNNSDTAAVTVSGSWPLIDIHGAADNARTTRKVVATLDLFPSAFAFGQAVYTNGSLNIIGNPTINGDVYATNEIDIAGNAAEISGNAISPGTITDSCDGNSNPNCEGSVSGTETEGYQEILPPTIVSDGYKALAVIDSPGNITSQSGSIVHYTTDASLNGGTYIGIIVVDGSLTLGGNITLSSGPASGLDEPLVLFVDGDLEIAGGTTINGVVYVTGQTNVNGNLQMNGSLISVNGTNFTNGAGNAEITYDYDDEDEDWWQNISGLDLESNSDSEPQMVNWHEE